ncbi:hypothetical protein CWI38_0027p0050 [Hamiltosporidium tvaerminnensis]|uniref:Uncharacterized protein n=1 Tax=Hamiltosporidium tvaerminnensis TaxID=1176355 RepID=A0A4Q9LSG2_9MICR|nr:hypothetical protein CWI38_1224p0010 [Hamiltosporidium tvaerminnensis]TBU20745.1 hypothetical protein CWI38_0027p0050 [Hamiltosporidium tvaerminnensis]
MEKKLIELENQLKSFILENLNGMTKQHSYFIFRNIKTKNGIKNIEKLIEVYEEAKQYKFVNLHLRSAFYLYKCISEEEISLRIEIIDLLLISDVSILEKIKIYSELKLEKECRSLIEKFKEENKIKTEIIGVDARLLKPNIRESAILFLNVESEEECCGKLSKKSKRAEFFTVCIKPLTIKEQIVLLAELEMFLFVENDELILKDIIISYLERLEYKENQKNIIIELNTAFYSTIYDISYESLFSLQKITAKNTKIPWNENIFEINAKFMIEKMRKIAKLNLKLFYFDAALKIFKDLKDLKNSIICLIGMGKEKEAINEALFKIKINTEELEKMQPNDKNRFFKKLEISDCYILLGSLTNNSKYYDLAYDAYKYFEPKKLKALQYFKNNDYENAVKCFEEAISVAPSNTGLLFSYGCALLKNNNLNRAVSIFTEILLKDEKHYKASVNLANCYFELGFHDKGIYILKNALKYNFNDSMARVYFLTSLKYRYYNECIFIMGLIKISESFIEKFINKLLEKEDFVLYNCDACCFLKRSKEEYSTDLNFYKFKRSEMNRNKIYENHGETEKKSSSFIKYNEDSLKVNKLADLLLKYATESKSLVYKYVLFIFSYRFQKPEIDLKKYGLEVFWDFFRENDFERCSNILLRIKNFQISNDVFAFYLKKFESHNTSSSYILAESEYSQRIEMLQNETGVTQNQ